MQKSDLTLKEVCEILGKSRRTVSRYISNGLLNPTKEKSDRGTLEYRFRQADIESLKIPGTDKIRQDTRQAIRQDTGQDDEVITLLKETTQVLRDQLIIKDKQIKSLSGKIDQLIERGLNRIKGKALQVQPKAKISVIKGKEDDNRILECAVEAGAQYIISGDKRHLLPLKEYQGVKILSPINFLGIMPFSNHTSILS